MRKETRVIFNSYLQNQARLNNLTSDEVSTQFTIEPSVQQSLETVIQESSVFLKKINILGVDDMKGNPLLVGVNGTIAGRTDTETGNKERNPRYVGQFQEDKYECVQTNFDTAFPYARLDQWAKFKDFQVRLTKAIAERQALDRIMIGFNGTEAAEETDRSANPLLQDVNVGWLEKVRTKAPDRTLTEVVEDSGKVTIGADGDYKTLDGLVFDTVQMLDPWHRGNPELIVIIPRSMLHARFLSAVEKGGDSNQEDMAADAIMTRTRIGGLPFVDAPFFPDGKVLVTTLSNLSIYYQNGKRRRHIEEEPKKNRIAHYESSNEAYVIEDMGLVAMVENIEAV